MLDIGWTEFFVIAVLTLIVVGPKDLPAALRAVTKVLRKARGLAREFQSGVDDLVREAELDEIRKDMTSVRNFDPVGEVKKGVDPGGTLTEDFDPVRFNRDLMDRMEKTKERRAEPPAAPSEAAASSAPVASSEDRRTADDGDAAPARRAGS